MHLYIVLAHPSERSFSRDVLDAFVAELAAAGHTFEVNDLYREGFQTDMDAHQYARETGGNPDAPLPEDVEREHARIARADALAFIFPVWWSDVPAKLKGWFDRVWSYGYAYFYEADGNRRTRVQPRRAVVICSAGHTEEHLQETGIADSMRTIMLRDRLSNVGFTEMTMDILGGMMPGNASHREANLERVRRIARALIDRTLPT